MTEVATQVVRTHQHILMDPTSFDQIIRVGDMLANSIMFPEHLRKGTPAQAKANGALVMNMAVRLNEDPLTIAQSIFFVGGRPGWHTQYMIAKANQHGTFSDQIDWDVSGKGDNLSVTAFATLSRTDRKVSMTCDMEMAKAENWVKNPKYKSMPEVMLRYRSAAFLIRMYAPEVMVGIPMQVELELDMKDVTPEDAAMKASTKKPAKKEPEDAVIVDETPHDPETGEVTEENKATPEDSKPKDDPKTEDKKPAEKEADAPAEKEPTKTDFGPIMSALKGDLLDAGAENISDVLEFYDPQVEEMKTAAPELYKELTAYIDDLKKAPADNSEA